MNTRKKPNEELSKFLDEIIFENDIFIRLSEQDRNKIISQNDEVKPFEPVKGRVMKEYVVLPESLYNHPEKFHELLSISYDYVSSLPAKQKKKN